MAPFPGRSWLSAGCCGDDGCSTVAVGRELHGDTAIEVGLGVRRCNGAERCREVDVCAAVRGDPAASGTWATMSTEPLMASALVGAVSVMVEPVGASSGTFRGPHYSELQARLQGQRQLGSVLTV